MYKRQVLPDARGEEDESPFELYTLDPRDTFVVYSNEIGNKPLMAVKYSKDDNAPVDIIARAEDASKIQRIFDRFELGNVDKGSIVANAEKSIAQREELANEVPTKSKGERIVEEAMGKPIQKDGASHENPTVAKTDKNPPSRQSSAEVDGKSDKGISKSAEEKPSVREKLERYKAQAKTEKEADRTDFDKSGEKPKSQNRTNQTTHQQPKKKKNRNKNKAR